MMEGQLSRLLGSLLDRGRAIQRRASQISGLLRAGTEGSALARLGELCRRLLSGKGEASGLKIAQEITGAYAALTAAERGEFFLLLADEYGVDWENARSAWRRNESAPGRASFQALVRALEPPRQELFRRINRAPGGTAMLLTLRSDLLPLIRERPEIGAVDDDLMHLLRSWFNRGFLVMERIDWTTGADLLERLIRYEAVHDIGSWEELRRRLLPADRRCYAFFHPALADDPLIFVEVALTRETPDSIQAVLAPDREIVPPQGATTAVFYSISNCQPGLTGISFGNFLIKQVVEELLRELPNLTTFVTLSPAPGFRRWLSAKSDLGGEAALAPLLAGSLDEEATERLAAEILPLAAEYYLEAKDKEGRPLDPVARFHLGNGARLERLCWPADTSANGLASGAALMVNYRYDLRRVDENHEAYANDQAVIASDAVKKLRKAKRGGKDAPGD